MSATELVCAAPLQQQLRRSSVGVALQPSTQLVVFVASLLEVLLAAPRGRTRRHLEEGREQRVVSAPSQQQQQATEVSRDDERSTTAGLFYFDEIVP